MKTLQDAKKHLRKHWEKGTLCPCCGKFVKRYKVNLSSSMAYCLILLYTHKRDEWVHVEDFLVDMGIKIKGVHGKLKYWGLLEQKPNTDENKKDSGIWRLTCDGEDFVTKIISVPKYVYLYNDKPLDFSEERIIITDALRDRFSYKELMQR